MAVFTSKINRKSDLFNNNNLITNNLFNVQLNQRKLKIIKEDGISEDNIDRIDEIRNLLQRPYNPHNKNKYILSQDEQDIILKAIDNQ